MLILVENTQDQYVSADHRSFNLIQSENKNVRHRTGTYTSHLIIQNVKKIRKTYHTL